MPAEASSEPGIDDQAGIGQLDGSDIVAELGKGDNG